MTFEPYDLVVIGGGSGGVRAARTAAGLGARVALAEQDRMGGTCVIRGCVPKKLMVFASAVPDGLDEARGYGWSLSEAAFDWPGLRTKLASELDRLERVYRNLLKNSGVDVFDARAALAGPNSVALSTGDTIEARHIAIATGGRAVRPDIPNAHLALVSDDVFNLPELPRTVLVYGGGYIACEFAAILQGLGVRVTQAFRGSSILRGFDEEAVGYIASGLRSRGVVHRHEARLARLDRIGPIGGPLQVTWADGPVETYDVVLMATGRRPNAVELGLETLGVALGDAGEIPVDAFNRTRVPSIFAIGDVNGRAALTPVAIREGAALAETLFGRGPVAVDYRLIPSAVYTRPELGTVGLSEEDARAREPVEIFSADFRPMRSAFAGTMDRVLMKLVVSRATRKVLGCHIVAPEAGEMIQLAAIPVGMGATKEDFDRVFAVHPTMAEELVTMRTPVRRSHE